LLYQFVFFLSPKVSGLYNCGWHLFNVLLTV